MIELPAAMLLLLTEDNILYITDDIMKRSRRH